MNTTFPHQWAMLRVCLILSVGGGAATALAAAMGLTTYTAVAPVAILLAGLGGVAHYWKTQHIEITMDQFHNALRRISNVERRVAETQGLVQLGSINFPYPLPFGGDFALTADAAAVLARQIALRQPKVVLELGSGVSTILVAKLLQDSGGGRIYSLDHDPSWAAETRRHIGVAGLQDYATVLETTLKEQHIDGQTFLWYDIPPELERLRQIDLLIVDGPPQHLDPGGLPRYPALPMLLSQLSENAEIFVDDAKRPTEQEMVRLWLERFPGWKGQMIKTVPGTCLLIRQTSSNKP